MRGFVRTNGLLIALIALFGLTAGQAMAQGWVGPGHGGWHMGGWDFEKHMAEADTVQGVLVEWVSPMGDTLYGVDTNGDSQMDVLLNLGPAFGTDQLPEVGSDVTVVGWIVHMHMIDMMIVQSINGVEVRPIPDDWEDWGHWTVMRDTVTASGTVMADTLFGVQFLYLDEDGDGEAEYYLDFGPPWYQPEGLSRPEPGDQVTVFGIVHEARGYKVLTVIELNGEQWRPPVGPPPWTGRWVHRHMRDSLRVISFGDSLVAIIIPPRAFEGTDIPDSLFWQIIPAELDSLISEGDTLMIAWKLRILGPTGREMLGHGRRMHFSAGLRIVVTVPGGGGLAKTAGTTYALRVWDEDTSSWVTVGTSSGGTIEGEVQELSSPYVGVFETSTATGLASEGTTLPVRTELAQNYPNPFNPTTEISYRLGTAGHVTLAVYDLTGRLVTTLVDKNQNPGEYRVRWNATDASGRALPAGVYLARLKVGELSQTIRMVLLK